MARRHCWQRPRGRLCEGSDRRFKGLDARRFDGHDIMHLRGGRNELHFFSTASIQRKFPGVRAVVFFFSCGRQWQGFLVILIISNFCTIHKNMKIMTMGRIKGMLKNCTSLTPPASTTTAFKLLGIVNGYCTSLKPPSVQKVSENTRKV